LLAAIPLGVAAANNNAMFSPCEFQATDVNLLMRHPAAKNRLVCFGWQQIDYTESAYDRSCA
jgi:hypothetical protein